MTVEAWVASGIAVVAVLITAGGVLIQYGMHRQKTTSLEQVVEDLKDAVKELKTVIQEIFPRLGDVERRQERLEEAQKNMKEVCADRHGKVH